MNNNGTSNNTVLPFKHSVVAVEDKENTHASSMIKTGGGNLTSKGTALKKNEGSKGGKKQDTTVKFSSEVSRNQTTSGGVVLNERLDNC